jgi:hypothetical protein
MLNQVLKGLVPWFRRLEQGKYVRLLLRWLSRRDINLRCLTCTMETTIASLFSAWESLISSQNTWS